MDEGGALERRSEREAAAGLWPIGRALTVAGIGAVVGLAAVTAVALAVLGFPHLAHHKALAIGDLLEVLKLVLGTVAGVGALAALVMNYRKQRLAEVVEVREHQRAGDERVRVFNERFATAAGQLGHAEPAVRLAGVYAMAGLADDWEHGRQTCIDVLCAYLRMPYEPDPGKDAPDAERLGFGRNQEVRHTVIAVIADRLRTDARTSWQGCDFDFTGVRFDGGDFSAAMFSGGRVTFDRARFSGGWISFTRARFCGAAVSFLHTKFCGGMSSFLLTEFSGGEISLSQAQFSGGQVFFSRAQFSGGTVDFQAAEFSGADVLFTDAEFSGGTMDFQGAKFSGGLVAFFDANFSGGYVSFPDAEFLAGEVSFTGAEFSGGTVDLSGAGSWAKPPLLGGADMARPPAGLLLPSAAAPPGA